MQQHNIEHFGLTELKTPLSLDFYKAWLDKDYHGDMTYLKTHLPAKTHPQSLLKQARSALVFTQSYYPAQGEFPLAHAKVAAYARQPDYHHWLKDKVEALCRDLKSLFPNEEFVGFTDSAPVLERDLAHRAGLGWFGKNTCLLDRRRGSLFFIAEIYTTLAAPESSAELPTDHCGTCTRCLDACPTGAIEEPYLLNAQKCIAYWTIESRQIPPESLRQQFSGWLFGCDICQTVCPWNIKLHRLAEEKPNPELIAQDLEFVLTASNKQLQKIFRATPLARAGGRGLKRNALIVAANLRLRSLLPLISQFESDAQLGGLARWSRQQILDQNSAH